MNDVTTMPKVLVVEDSSVIQMYYRQIFAKLPGYQASFTKNGREALDHIGKHGMPDVVVLDINMPVMDGLEFLGHFKGDRTATPARVDHRDDRGARGRLTSAAWTRARAPTCSKPFTPEALDRVCCRACSRSRSGRGRYVSRAETPAHKSSDATDTKQRLSRRA